MRIRRLTSIFALLVIVLSMIMQFHHHDIHGCPVIAVNESVEMAFCHYSGHGGCNHSPASQSQQCSFSQQAFVYTVRTKNSSPDTHISIAERGKLHVYDCILDECGIRVAYNHDIVTASAAGFEKVISKRGPPHEFHIS